MMVLCVIQLLGNNFPIMDTYTNTKLKLSSFILVPKSSVHKLQPQRKVLNTTQNHSGKKKVSIISHLYDYLKTWKLLTCQKNAYFLLNIGYK